MSDISVNAFGKDEIFRSHERSLISRYRAEIQYSCL